MFSIVSSCFVKTIHFMKVSFEIFQGKLKPGLKLIFRGSLGIERNVCGKPVQVCEDKTLEGASNVLGQISQTELTMKALNKEKVLRTVD